MARLFAYRNVFGNWAVLEVVTLNDPEGMVRCRPDLIDANVDRYNRAVVVRVVAAFHLAQTPLAGLEIVSPNALTCLDFADRAQSNFCRNQRVRREAPQLRS